jgi:cytidine deaminase
MLHMAGVIITSTSLMTWVIDSHRCIPGGTICAERTALVKAVVRLTSPSIHTIYTN